MSKRPPKKPPIVELPVEEEADEKPNWLNLNINVEIDIAGIICAILFGSSVLAAVWVAS